MSAKGAFNSSDGKQWAIISVLQQVMLHIQVCYVYISNPVLHVFSTAKK
jgi:hypothetical protein